MTDTIQHDAKWAMIWALASILVALHLPDARGGMAGLFGAAWLASTLWAGSHAGKVAAKLVRQP